MRSTNGDDHGLPPEHDAMIPFTRMLVGSTDYPLGGFRAVPRAGYIQRSTPPAGCWEPAATCSRCTLYWKLTLGMVCDYPVAYEGQLGFDFVKRSPRSLGLKQSDRCHARRIHRHRPRKGKDWYIGAASPTTSRLKNSPSARLSAGERLPEPPY